jgi:hypothetical protein
MRSTGRSSMAVLALLLALHLVFSSRLSFAFDISAYWDPVSVVQLEGQSLDTCAKSEWIRAVGPENCEVLQWYKEMGITNLCVHYRAVDYASFLDSCAAITRDSVTVMNERWPDEMFKYLEAQGA